MVRISAWTWPFPFGVRLGWASTGTPNPDRQTAPGRVYLLRGNGIVFSRGLGKLCGELRRRGVWAEDLRCVGDLWARRHIAADRRAGLLNGAVIFVGHSCGGRYSLHAAHRLQELGIGVDLIVTLDVALPPDVPGNVKWAVNLYRGGRRLYPARPLRRVPGSSAAIDNIDLDAPGAPVRAWWLNHLTLTDSVLIRELVLQRILESIRRQAA
jgi:hypothetical protein